MDNYQQKITHLRSLYHLACADQELSEVEATYIRNVAQRLGIDTKELEKFDGSEPALDLPNREYKVYAIFHRLAIITMIDGHLHEQERVYCFNLGIKMGLHPNAVSEIISLVEKKGSFDMLPSEVMSIFKKYLN